MRRKLKKNGKKIEKKTKRRKKTRQKKEMKNQAQRTVRKRKNDEKPTQGTFLITPVPSSKVCSWIKKPESQKSKELFQSNERDEQTRRSCLWFWYDFQRRRSSLMVTWWTKEKIGALIEIWWTEKKIVASMIWYPTEDPPKRNPRQLKGKEERQRKRKERQNEKFSWSSSETLNKRVKFQNKETNEASSLWCHRQNLSRTRTPWNLPVTAFNLYLFLFFFSFCLVLFPPSVFVSFYFFSLRSDFPFSGSFSTIQWFGGVCKSYQKY